MGTGMCMRVDMRVGMGAGVAADLIMGVRVSAGVGARLGMHSGVGIRFRTCLGVAPPAPVGFLSLIACGLDRPALVRRLRAHPSQLSAVCPPLLAWRVRLDSNSSHPRYAMGPRPPRAPPRVALFIPLPIDRSA